MKVKGRDTLIAYIASDVALNTSARVFQIYCTWLYIDKFSSTESLSGILLASWLTNTILLPFAGVLTERVKKGYVLLFCACSISAAAMLAILLATNYGDSGDSIEYFRVLVALSVVFGVGTALLFPLGVPLIPEIFDTESEVQRGLKIKASMFIVNLLFGPTLAGLVIGGLGGRSALALCCAAATFGSITAVYFAMKFTRPPAKANGNFRLYSLLLDLVGGALKITTIRAEFSIAVASLFANILFIPFLFVILPQKILRSGYSMLDLAIVELSLGIGIVLASKWLVRASQSYFSNHTIATTSILLIGISIGACSLTEKLSLLCIFAIGLGIGLTVFNVVINTKRALAIPAGFRSTMESAMLFACTAAVPLGLWISKVILETVSANQLILYGTLTFSVAVLIVALSAPLRTMLNQKGSDTPYYKITNPALFVD